MRYGTDAELCHEPPASSSLAGGDSLYARLFVAYEMLGLRLPAPLHEMAERGADVASEWFAEATTDGTLEPEFAKALEQIADMHRRKNADYGAGDDPYANVRASSQWGVAPWAGAMIRLNDKVHRLREHYRTDSPLANEGVEDSLYDIAVYALIALVLYREETAPSDVS